MTALTATANATAPAARPARVVRVRAARARPGTWTVQVVCGTCRRTHTVAADEPGQLLERAFVCTDNRWAARPAHPLVDPDDLTTRTRR